MIMNATPTIPRRDLLRHCAGGLGLAAFAALSTRECLAAAGRPALHHRARAKHLIFLFMSGGPSQVDTFDPKPALRDMEGKKLEVPNARNAGYPFALPSAYAFARHGQSGLEISELFPEVATCADHLAVIRSLCADDNNHPGGTLQMFTGSARSKRPSLGAWLTYGLGSENDNLPGFVNIGDSTRVGAAVHASNFLPASTQGTTLRVGKGDAIRNAKPWMSPADQRAELDLLAAMNRRHAAAGPAGDDRLEARIEAAELAFRMQVEAPEAVDFSRESEATRKLYGIDDARTANFGMQCLAARRLVERGVRVVQITQDDREWDHHGQLKAKLKASSYQVDRPIAGLIKDLAARGLLDDTLVLWGGEFGRTPTSQGPDMDSRAHYPTAFTMWMAGGGVRGGTVHGQTDKYGCNIEHGRMHVHDLHATLLWAMGLDHERLTYRFGGREYRLTDVYGNVVRELFA